MTIEETGAVLAACALFDNRKTDPHIVIMWHRVIGDLPYQDCEDAVVAHYAETAERIMPAHIRGRVKTMRSDRLARDITPAPPPELTDQPGRYQAELQAGVRQIADGRHIRLALAPVREDAPPQEFTDARAVLGPALPRNKRELAALQAAESRAAREAADDRDRTGEPA